MKRKMRVAMLLFAYFLIALSQVQATADTKTIQRTLPAYALAVNADLLNSTRCQRELENFRNGVDSRLLWALKMLDFSGKPKPGFIYGNNYWLGSKSGCMDSTNRSPLMMNQKTLFNNSQFRNPEEEFPPYAVNYFAAHFRHNSTLQYHIRLPNEDLVTLGLCLPASCSVKELGLILNKIFRERTLLMSDLYSADFKLVEVRDLQDDHQWLLTGRFFILGLVLVLTLAAMLIGTTYDIFVHQKYLKAKEKMYTCDNTKPVGHNGIKLMTENTEAALSEPPQESRFGKIIMCFSIYTNTKLLFDTKLGADSIPAVHGLRFLGMVWIVMIHTIFYMGDYTDNKPLAWRMAEGISAQIISNSTLSVDTFFFLSGFLVAYLFFKAQKGKTEHRPVNYYWKVMEFLAVLLKRFIRLTPAYMLTVGIAELNFGWYGKTSQFYMTERPHDVCAKYWWRNILYINNLFGRESMCLSWSWYLSNDMQFFVIGNFLLILSTIYFKLATVILAVMLAGSLAITAYISYIYEYVPTLDLQYELLDVLYDPPWTRIGPYIIGIITAYIIVKLNNKLILKKRTVVALWCLGSSCNLLILFGIYERYLSLTMSAVYVSLSRTMWAVGIAWLLIACCTHHGGIINEILSFKGWIPLSRMTYCAYLINPFIINSVFLNSDGAARVDFLYNGAMFMGNLMCSYFCAYALSLMMETPYVLLVRMLTNGRSKKK